MGAWLHFGLDCFAGYFAYLNALGCAYGILFVALDCFWLFPYWFGLPFAVALACFVV